MPRRPRGTPVEFRHTAKTHRSFGPSVVDGSWYLLNQLFLALSRQHVMRDYLSALMRPASVT